MPRKPRFNLPGIPQHIIQRGNNREPCFLAKEDYQRYLHDLTKAASKYRCNLLVILLLAKCILETIVL
ncbi:MAG: hypothetical protein GY935_22925 [Gammaproteobacteria bacterium]|nr:hypothetical protein [Gammaproteobacteria bacterium]